MAQIGLNDSNLELINVQNESSLHAAIKNHIFREGDLVEARYKGFIIDLIRDGLLIEIQTKNFGGLRKKIKNLIDSARIRIVHPIVVEKRIVLMDAEENRIIRSRRSPKKGDLWDVFDELIYIHKWFEHINLEIQLLFVKVEERRADDSKGSWRRGGVSIIDAGLDEVIDEKRFIHPFQFIKYFPPLFKEKAFTTADLAKGLKITKNKARKIAYCLRECGIFTITGKKGNAYVYVLKQ